ncbi:VRR-NUC domain-containing protein [Achromobacter seleniivolatilans]|uniref:VRR-NUC domain-containing protein n=1 Tax=Achromobacter seleniivolatilans TaxID=3047478 RepID=A0ABY9LWL7_9BURK|nr:VRR-NUC domain-containing protein [Achromobacter sp. R39]WMD19179.1 VRR-NUC domain-containing protein [Achromobacter sp. R39]
MAAPVIAAGGAAAVRAMLVWGNRAFRAHRANEAAQLAVESAEVLAEISKRKKEVETVLKDVIKGLKEEIDIKSSTFVRTGGNATVSRGRNENVTYKHYIERKIPFRPVISTVCQWALKSPIKVPRRIRKKIPGEVIETTIDVLLKQTTASLVFEAVDDLLEWQSPLKAEPNYNGTTYAAMLGEPSTRPQRISDYFPFWPRPKGSLAPDLVIVEYRQKPFDVSNVFAAVEIKFPNDWVKKKQMTDYLRLMNKDTEKVALLRVPEDCTGYKSDADEKAKNGRQTPRRGK